MRSLLLAAEINVIESVDFLASLGEFNPAL